MGSKYTKNAFAAEEGHFCVFRAKGKCLMAANVVRQVAPAGGSYALPISLTLRRGGGGARESESKGEEKERKWMEETEENKPKFWSRSCFSRSRRTTLLPSASRIHV